MAVTGIVLAAGRGSRFAEADPAASPKMLVPIDGVPMVRRTVESLLAGGVHYCVVVVSATGRAAVGQALKGLPVRLVINQDPARGMFSSVQRGLRGVRVGDLCVLLPGDMPFVLPSTVAAVVAEARRTRVTVAAAFQGHRGHPIVPSSDLRAQIAAAAADSRLDHEMDKDLVVTVEVADPGVRRDVDRPETSSEARLGGTG